MNIHGNITIVENCDEELVKEIRAKIKANDGYCPCCVEHTPETKCMCKSFRDQLIGECHCGLYEKIYTR